MSSTVLLKSKSRKKIFKLYWSYIDFGKVLKKTEKSKYLQKYWVSWPDIRLVRKENQKLDNKKKSDSPTLRYIFYVGVSAGHVIPWIGDQNFFYSQECLRKVPGTKLKSKNQWTTIVLCTLKNTKIPLKFLSP